MCSSCCSSLRLPLISEASRSDGNRFAKSGLEGLPSGSFLHFMIDAVHDAFEPQLSPGTRPFPLLQFQSNPVYGRIFHDPQCCPPAREIRSQVLPDVDDPLRELMSCLTHNHIDLPLTNA